MKLMIAIPTIDYVHYVFCRCLGDLIRHLDAAGVNFDVRWWGNTLVHHARDGLTREAVVGGYTHMLWLDADMIFPETIVEDLAESGHYFVTGVYHARRPPHRSCVFTRLVPNVERPGPEYGQEPFRIAGCGFGCVLVEVDLMRRVDFHTGQLFMPDSAFGEDLAFCQRATGLGYELWCDPRVVCGHIGQMAVYQEAQHYQEAGEAGYRGIYG